MILIKMEDGVFGNPGAFSKDSARRVYGLQLLRQDELKLLGYYIVRQEPYDEAISTVAAWGLDEDGYATQAIVSKVIDVETEKLRLITERGELVSGQIDAIVSKHVQEAYFDPSYVIPQGVTDSREALLLAYAEYKAEVEALETEEEVLRYAQ